MCSSIHQYLTPKNVVSRSDMNGLAMSFRPGLGLPEESPTGLDRCKDTSSSNHDVVAVTCVCYV